MTCRRRRLRHLLWLETTPRTAVATQTHQPLAATMSSLSTPSFTRRRSTTTTWTQATPSGVPTQQTSSTLRLLRCIGTILTLSLTRPTARLSWFFSSAFSTNLSSKKSRRALALVKNLASETSLKTLPSSTQSRTVRSPT